MKMNINKVKMMLDTNAAILLFSAAFGVGVGVPGRTGIEVPPNESRPQLSIMMYHRSR